MSYVFELIVPDVPRVAEIRDALGYADVVVPDAELWPQGSVHLHRAGVSTRDTEVTRTLGTMTVTIRALASLEDHDLALRLVEVLAERGDGLVRPEWGGEVPAARLRDQHDPDWALGNLRASVDTTFALLRDADERFKRISIPGAVRDAHFGPRLATELGPLPPDERAERTIELVRRVQWIEREGAHAASLFVATTPEGEERKIAFWTEGTRVLLPAIEEVVVADPDRRIFHFVRPESVPDLSLGSFEWVDERQPLVEPFEGEDWLALLDRAREVALR